MPSRSRRPPGPRYQLRWATLRDLDLLVAHRLAMFRDLHDVPEAALRDHGAQYRAWVRPRLKGGRFIGVIAEDSPQSPAASGCLWFQPSQPRVLIPGTATPYILSMYTAPEHRRRGLAARIVRRLIEEARRRRYPRVTLHASPMGRPVYEKLGFEATSEMRLWLDARLARRMQRHVAAPGSRLSSRPPSRRR